ncbi:MAG: DNA gyrase inhibitor YacG [Pseudomonadota bacterium]
MASCPVCKQPTEKSWRPFCSKRCADIDLGRWMTGAYSVPVESDELPPVETDQSGPTTH